MAIAVVMILAMSPEVRTKKVIPKGGTTVQSSMQSNVDSTNSAVESTTMQSSVVVDRGSDSMVSNVDSSSGVEEGNN